MHSLLTPRLRHRPLERGDLRAFHELYTDPVLMRYITGRPRVDACPLGVERACLRARQVTVPFALVYLARGAGARRAPTTGSGMESLKGHLLISSGGLFDPNFRHTVVLLGEHNEEGALGVVLNRPLDVGVAEALPLLEDLVPAGSALFQGGPVQPQSPVLLAELRRPELADLWVFGSVGFLIGEVPTDIVPDIIRARLYAGYSGWGPGQLEAELAEDSWIVDPATAGDVFTASPELLWSRVVRRKGPEYEHLSKMPYDPSMN